MTAEALRKLAGNGPLGSNPLNTERNALFGGIITSYLETGGEKRISQHLSNSSPEIDEGNFRVADRSETIRKRCAFAGFFPLGGLFYDLWSRAVPPKKSFA